ncbi:sigma-70 family RNA polymerase sigma factor [Euzebya sp.]|uniref:sigma-70 family RNA polymerase sigma factor n=1 Tax=Euzebya sp. TaxID=1971409 RepID=UPI0035113615
MTPEEAFAAHYARLTGLARRLVDPATAEEVAADAIAKLDDAPVADRGDADVAAWLNRVTVNAALNRIRSRQREQARVAVHGRSVDPTPDDTPDVVADRHETQDRVRAVLAELPDRQATALLLRHSGHPYAEIAATLGVAEGSVGVLLARGERAFRRRWEDPTTADPAAADPAAGDR